MLDPLPDVNKPWQTNTRPERTATVRKYLKRKKMINSDIRVSEYMKFPRNMIDSVRIGTLVTSDMINFHRNTIARR